MAEHPVLYRKRMIPDECVMLKEDVILYQDNDMIITKWKAIHVRPNLGFGFSCYLPKKGCKISKIYREDSTFRYWYCDIITTESVTGTVHTPGYTFGANSYIFTDLLADVVIEPDGKVRLLDLDEIAQAFEEKQLSPALAIYAFRALGDLLQAVNDGHFQQYMDLINGFDAFTSI